MCIITEIIALLVLFFSGGGMPSDPPPPCPPSPFQNILAPPLRRWPTINPSLWNSLCLLGTFPGNYRRRRIPKTNQTAPVAPVHVGLLLKSSSYRSCAGTCSYRVKLKVSFSVCFISRQMIFHII